MKNQTSFRGEKGRSVFKISLAVVGALILAAYGNAQDVSLYNLGSTVNFDLGGGSTTPIGMNGWTVDTQPSISQLNQQWFWYSINTGSGWTAMQSIDQISAANVTTYNNGASESTLDATYQNATLAVQISYSLVGDGSLSGGGDLNQSVDVLNLSGSSFEIRFYQYANFNLLQNNMNSIVIGGGPPDGYTFISQTTSSGGNGIEETISQPYANYAEAGVANGVYTDVTTGNTLGGNDSFMANGQNAAWALEWDNSVSPFADTDTPWYVVQDQSMSIQPVPEPTSVAWMAMAMGVFGFVRQAWKRKI